MGLAGPRSAGVDQAHRRVAALAGALAGAWLAFHAAGVRLSLLTAIAGALGQPARLETEMLDVRDHQPATPTGSACPDGSVTGSPDR